MKRALAAFLFVLITRLVHAQDSAESSFFTLVPQAGFNTSRLTTDSKDGGRLGYQFGLSAQVGQRFYVQPGVFWLRQFPNYLDENSNQTLTEDDIDIHGVQVQALAGYRLVDSRVIKLRANAGPALSWVSRVKDNNFSLQKGDFNSPIWGGKVGGGIDVFFLSLDVNYEFGLSNVFQSQTEHSAAKNNVLSVNLGARLAF
jgi:hypothetical protein